MGKNLAQRFVRQAANDSDCPLLTFFKLVVISVLKYTPRRTARSSGPKSQVLKPIFLS